MKKLLFILILLLSLVGCSQKNTEINDNNKNVVANYLDDGYIINSSSFSEEEWKALLSKDDDHLVVEAKMTSKLYEEANEVFFEDDKYQEFIKKLEIVDSYSVNDKLPTSDELEKYVGKTFGEIEDEGFYSTGYIESDNYQYNFIYENDVICLTLKSSADTPIMDMNDFSNNDIREIKVEKVVDCCLSSNILYEEH